METSINLDNISVMTSQGSRILFEVGLQAEGGRVGWVVSGLGQFHKHGLLLRVEHLRGGAEVGAPGQAHAEPVQAVGYAVDDGQDSQAQ